MTKENIQYGKITTEVSIYDWEQTSEPRQWYEVSKFSTKKDILIDVIDALAMLNSGETHKMNLEIMVDTQGRYRLLKKWAIK